MPTRLPHNTPSIDLEDIGPHWPPIADFSNETPTQRNERLEREREAKRINDEIDAQIETEKSERRGLRPDFKIILVGETAFFISHLFSFLTFSLPFPSSFFLILFFSGLSHTGQNDSDKSTILRNFRLKYAPTDFHAEEAAWRAVIDLNLVRSVTFILNVLEESSPAAADAGSGMDTRPTSPSGTNSMPVLQLTDDLRRLRVRLSPLRSIEEPLARFVSPEHSAGSSSAARPTERAFEVSTRSGSRWKTLSEGPGGGRRRATSKARSQEFEKVQNNARRVIEACRENIVALWNHPAVRASLADQSVPLEFHSGLCVTSGVLIYLLQTHDFTFLIGSFLDAADRIAAPGYEPSPGKSRYSARSLPP